MTPKKSIPKGLKEQVWLKHVGQKFNAKCTVSWCTNIITPFNYHCAHIIAESKDHLPPMQPLHEQQLLCYRVE